MGQGQALPTDTYIGIKDNFALFFGRINYINDKSTMTFTMRADGSSKFASGNQWGYFPSLALVWRISNEAMRNSQEWLSNLKLLFKHRYGRKQSDSLRVARKQLLLTGRFGRQTYLFLTIQAAWFCKEVKLVQPELEMGNNAHS